MKKIQKTKYFRTADPAVTKVFHDGEYDVLILKRDYGFSFAGLFDTRIAAAALGKVW